MIPITRDRPLTPAEIAKYKTLRALIDQDLPDLIARHHNRMAGGLVMQKMVLEKEQSAFTHAIDRLLAEGYAVVPGTLVINVSPREPLPRHYGPPTPWGYAPQYYSPVPGTSPPTDSRPEYHYCVFMELTPQARLECRRSEAIKKRDKFLDLLLGGIGLAVEDIAALAKKDVITIRDFLKIPTDDLVKGYRQDRKDRVLAARVRLTTRRNELQADIDNIVPE